MFRHFYGLLTYYLKVFFLSIDFCSLDWKFDGIGLKGLLLFSVSGPEFLDLLLDLIAGITVSKKAVREVVLTCHAVKEKNLMKVK